MSGFRGTIFPFSIGIALGLGFGLGALWKGSSRQGEANAPSELTESINESMKRPSSGARGAGPEVSANNGDIAFEDIPLPITARNSAVVDVVRQNIPAVVTLGLRVVRPKRRPSGLPVRSLLRPYADELFRTFTEGPDPDQLFPYVGSGFIIDESNLLGRGFNPNEGDPDARYVITNYHVIEAYRDASILITLTDGREFPATLLDADAFVDVALLRLEGIEGEIIPTVRVGDSDDLSVGEGVIALGNPFGPVLRDPRPTVTVGVVSALGRSLQPGLTQNGGPTRAYVGMIQTDASINPGNSGGPLVNFDGEVVGINTFVLSRDGQSSTGVNFAMPIGRAIAVAAEILKFGRVLPITIDLDVWTVNRYLINRYGLETDRGLLVWKIAAEGPGRAAGLKEGDVIERVEGRPVLRPEDLYAHIYSRTVGETIRLSVSRKGRQFETDYKIAEAQEDDRGG